MNLSLLFELYESPSLSPLVVPPPTSHLGLFYQTATATTSPAPSAPPLSHTPPFHWDIPPLGADIQHKLLVPSIPPTAAAPGTWMCCPSPKGGRVSEEGCGHPSLCCASSPAPLCVKSAQTGHSTYHVFAQGRPWLGLPGNYQMLLWLCREARILREGLLIAFWPWGAVLDKLLYNHCTQSSLQNSTVIFFSYRRAALEALI